MTVFAGIASLNNVSISERSFNEFKATFKSICGTQSSLIYRDKKKFLFNANFSTKSNTNNHEGRPAKVCIAGKPFISKSLENSLQSDIDLLSNNVDFTSLQCELRRSRGVFSGISIDEKNDLFYLYTDKMGIRPVYYYKVGNTFIYSSLLSLLVTLPNIDLTIDNTGLCEFVSFGFCLADRTPYAKIKRLDAGQILSVNRKDNLVSNSTYWNWDNIESKKTLCSADITELYNKFNDAVDLRLGNSKTAIAFLSGGLDSRVITSILNEKTKEVHSFNFATSKSQDNEFAKRYAEFTGLIHNETLLSTLSFPNWSQLISNALSNYKNSNVKHCRQVWSGDGGSVSLGGVYLDKSIIDNRKYENSLSLSKTLLRKLKVAFPISFTSQKYRKVFNQLLETSVSCELINYQQDLCKTLYHFLMNNDQKRHLQLHFETIHQHKVELELPFFDAVFLEKIYQLPKQELLLHNLYMKWFEMFPEKSRQTPWQTYPGHITCPVPSGDEFSYQWNQFKKNKSKRKEDFSFFLSLLKNEFIFRYLDKHKVFLSMFLHRLGIKDYSYLLEKLRRFSLVSPLSAENSEKTNSKL